MRLWKSWVLPLAVLGVSVVTGPAAQAALLDVMIRMPGGGHTKSLDVMEGEQVILDLFVSGMPDEGLGGYSVSLRSSRESMDNGVAWPVQPSVADTVVNAIAAQSGQGDGGLWDQLLTNGTVVDLPATNPPSGPGDLDTDRDLRGLGGFQDGQLDPYVTGLGQGVPYMIGSVVVLALDLDELLRPLTRSVQLNAYKTALNGANGGTVLQMIPPTGGNLVSIPLADIQIGEPAVINVVPEPASLVLGGLGLAALVGLAIRRRKA